MIFGKLGNNTIDECGSRLRTFDDAVDVFTIEPALDIVNIDIVGDRYDNRLFILLVQINKTRIDLGCKRIGISRDGKTFRYNHIQSCKKNKQRKKNQQNPNTKKSHEKTEKKKRVP